MMDLLHKWSRREFSYGAADCCQFVGECVEHLTGSNPMREFSYASEDEANDIIADYGGLEQAITATLGEPCDLPRDGSVSLHKLSNGRMMAGVVYRKRCIVRTVRGLTDWPLNYAQKFWST